MSNIYYQNFNVIDLQSQITTSISSNSYYNYSSNEKYSNKMLKQKRVRNKNDKNDYEELISQYYIEEYFDCYNYDSYDYSQKSCSEFQKEEIDFAKLKSDLMPK